MGRLTLQELNERAKDIHNVVLWYVRPMSRYGWAVNIMRQKQWEFSDLSAEVYTHLVHRITTAGTMNIAFTTAVTQSTHFILLNAAASINKVQKRRHERHKQQLPADEEIIPIADHRPSLSDQYDVADWVRHRLQFLRRDGQEMLQMLFGLNGNRPMSFNEISEYYGVSASYIRKRVDTCLQHLHGLYLRDFSR